MPLDLRPVRGLFFSPIRLALALVLGFALLLLAGLARPQAAFAVCGGAPVLTASCFEGGDGNLSADGGLLFADNVDWATVADELLFADPASPGTQFNNSSDEQNPTSWSLTSGEPSTNKLDITAAAARIERSGSNIWMHVGFTMKAAAGSANVLVELNRNGVPAGANPLPQRSAGDALIQFTGNANQAARIGLCQWVGNQFGQGPGGSGSFGWYTTPLPGSLITSSNKDCTQVSGGGNPSAIGKVNDGVVLNNLKDETQQVTLTGPNAGTFTLTFNGQTTGPIARNASAATVQSALVALSNIDVADVSVSAPAAGGPFTIRFTGAYAATDVAQVTGAGSALFSISTLGQGGTTTYLPSPPFAAPTIPADVFGEMSINLTQSLGAGGANPCFSFGSVWLHTYNGNSISSIMADYVNPQSLLGASSCAVSVDKKVAVSQDGVNPPAAGAAYHEGTPADPSSAQVGDYLWYRLALTNSGTAALTPSITDTGCDLPVNPTPIEKQSSSNFADATPASFDGGDVWTYLCKHQLAAGDPEPYVNTVKAKGINGSFTTPEVQDSASTSSDGTLTVTKDFTGPFEATHRVNLLVGGAVKAPSVGDGGTTPAVTVAGGASVTFGEAFTTGSAAQYVSSASCVDTKRTAGTGDDTPVSSSFDAAAHSGSVTVGGRKAILCTITNARRTGTIKVVKDLDPATDAGRFALSVDGSARDVASGPGSGAGNFANGSASAAISVATGTHSVAEIGAANPATSLADYVTSVSCTKNSVAYIAPTAATSLASISVADGDAVVCTFVNTRKGSLKIVKDFSGPFEAAHRVTIGAAGSQRDVAGGPNDGTPNFADQDATAAITVDGGSLNSFSEAYVAPATAAQYTASAECRDGQDQSVASSFSAATLAGSVTVAPGASITCTITNARRTGTIKVVKDLVPVSGQLGDPGRFDLQVDGATERADAADGDATGVIALPTGGHTVGELAGSSTSLADYDASVACEDELGAAVTTSGTASPWSLTLAAGTDVVCTITNVRKEGTVKLIKDIVPVDAQAGDGGRFDLHIDGEGDYDAATDEAGDGDFVERTVPNGAVDLFETADDETSLGDYATSYACQNQAPGNDDDPLIDGGTAIEDLLVTAGDAWVCTLTNVRRQGSVTLVKDVVPVDAQLGDPGRFDLGIDAGNGYTASKDEAGDGDEVSLDVPTGAVDLSETADDETDLSDYLSSYTCTNLATDNEDEPVSGSGPSIDDLEVADGDQWRCMLRNERKQGAVQLTKVIVAVDTLLGDPGRFDLEIDGEGAYDESLEDAVNGDSIAINVPNGSVDLSEAAGTATDLGDYDSAWSCENVAPGNDDLPVSGSGTSITGLDVSAGDQWHCTFTNTRQRGDVKVVKDIVPVDEQLGDPGKFDLKIDGEGGYDAAKDEAGDGDSVERTVPNGTVDVSEDADGETSLEDYVSTYRCENDGDDPVSGEGTSIEDLPVTSGDSWVCTFTNTRKQGSVKLVKDIVPVDEQAGDPGKFDLAIDGEGEYDDAKSDAGDGDSITLTVPNGSVDLSEAAGTATSLNDYVSTYRCENDGDDPVSGEGTSIEDLPVTSGDSWVCTFTNTRKQGSVKLVKDIVPVDEQAGDPGKFDLAIDGEGDYDDAKSDAGDGDSITLTVPNGSVDLSEAAGTATSLNDYVSTYRCENDGDDPVTGNGTSIEDLRVSADDAWVCTFRNVRKQASVKLVKDIVPVDEQLGDPGKFDLKIDGEGDYDAEQGEAGDGDFVELSLPNGVVDLEETADGETSLDDYITSYRCENSAPGSDDEPLSGEGTAISDLAVTSGDRWTCVMRNERKRGTVTLVKDIVPVDAQLGDPGKFNLSIDGDGGHDAAKADAGDGDSVTATVPNGAADLSEAAGTATDLDDYTSAYRCENEGDDPVTGDGIAIDDLLVSAGDAWTCTFTNTRKRGDVRLTKIIVSVDGELGDPGRFDLEIDGEGDHDVTLDDAVNGDSVERSVPTGPVDLTEDAGTATDLADYTSTYRCVNTAQGSEDEPVTGEGTTITNLVVGDGEVWHCTFTNTRKHGVVRLTKEIVPIDARVGDTGLFDLEIDGEGGYDAVKRDAGDGDYVELDAPNGTVDLRELAGTDTTLSDYSSSYHCENLQPGNEDADVNGTGTSLDDLPVTHGDLWSCTVTNTRKQGTVTVIKHLSPTSDEGRFNLSITGPLDHSVTGHERGHNGSVTLDMPTGTASFSETAAAGTELGAYTSSYRCENAAQGSEDEPLGGSGTTGTGLVVSAGDDWVCTFTNVRQPRVIVKKLTEPAGDDATTFAFSSDLPQSAAGEGTQAIGQDGTFALKHGEQVTTQVAPGSYSVTEGDVYAQNYKLKSAVCEETISNDDGFSQQSNEQTDGDRTRSFTADPGDVITCTFVNENLVGLQVVAKTPKSQSAYLDQNVSYSYEVTNTGTSDLTDVTVADDKCPGPAVRQADAIGDGDAVLEPGEKWTYTCTVAASSIFTGDLTQVTNTVTVNANDQAGKPVAPSTDTAVTNLLKPGIAIDKTGPATATAGDLLTYQLKVTNTGNTAFSDGMVVLTDAQCQAPPALLSKNGDVSPETLSPGESWTYSCQVQTQAGQQKVDNVGSVAGTDQGGRVVTASDTASTALSQPAAQALPNPPVTRVPGSAKLRGTVGCALASYARAAISGKQIKSVTFSVNGKKLRTLTKPTSGSQYSMRVQVRSLRYGAHKVTARVVFASGARTKSKTLTLQFSRCRPRVVQPKFTG